MGTSAKSFQPKQLEAASLKASKLQISNVNLQPPSNQSSIMAHTSFLSSSPPRVQLPVQSPSLKLSAAAP